MHNSSRNSATIIRKFRDQGSKFRHETKGLLPSFATIQEVHIQNVHSSPYGKTEKDFLIIACIIAAETRLLLLGNFETKARNLGMRPKVCCRPLLLFWKSFVVNDSFLTLSVHLVLYLFVLTLHAYHSFSYLSQSQSITWQPHF